MGLNLSVDFLAVVLLAMAFGLLAASLYSTGEKPQQASLPQVASEGPVFLFDNDQLIDCNAAARALLSSSVTRGGDWQRLMSFLQSVFDKIDEKLASLAQRGAIAETGEVGNGKVMLLQAELVGGLVRIALSDPDIADGAGTALAIAHHALDREVQDLRQAVSSAPVLMWRESARGEVVWANNAYFTFATATAGRGRDIGWPLPRLFDRSTLETAQSKCRCSVIYDMDGQKKTSWFDIIVETQPSSLLCYAQSVDAVVTAEANLRDFIDTLAKTFAQLPIGLAIFDRDRVLQMFNPALVELTTLPPDFLARRPSLLAVLDAMRDRNLLPEPKDYRSWRRQIVEMERAAASGLFQENWALPDGQTFRVTGRPHAKGGLALMIEDISNEMQRSRRYRADLEVNQSVMDNLDEAIVVFGQSGQLMWCNAAYCDLWGHDPAGSLQEVSIRTLTTQWVSRAAPNAIWVEIDEFIHTIGIREAWAKDIRLLDGRLIRCRVAPIAAGATMIAFHSAAAQSPLQETPNTAAAKRSTTKATAAR